MLSYFHRADLDALGAKHGTDKASKQHDYLRFYQFFLEKFRDDDFVLMELGVGPSTNMGKSLLTWKDFFPRAQIVGVDIRRDAASAAGDRIAVEIGDCSNLAFLSALSEKYPRCRVVVDDASHKWSHQILGIETLFRIVEPGGIYIIEDLHTSFFDIADNGYADAAQDAYSYLQQLACLVLGSGRSHSLMERATPMQRALATQIESIAFARRTAVIVKKG